MLSPVIHLGDNADQGVLSPLDTPNPEHMPWKDNPFKPAHTRVRIIFQGRFIHAARTDATQTNRMNPASIAKVFSGFRSAKNARP